MPVVATEKELIAAKLVEHARALRARDGSTH